MKAVLAERLWVNLDRGLKTRSRAERGQKRTRQTSTQVIDGMAKRGFPLRIHRDATYGSTIAAFEAFAEILPYWSPPTP